MLTQCEVRPGETIEYDLQYVTDSAVLEECIEWLQQQRQIGLDLETSGVRWNKDHIATLQVGNPFKGKVWVIDVRCFSRNQLRPVLDVLENPAVLKVGANLQFEYLFLRQHYGIRLANLADTQIVELTLRAGLFPISKSANDDGEGANRKAYGLTKLETVARRHLGIDIDKDHDLRTSFYATGKGQHSRAQLIYAANDVVYPFYVLQEQHKEVVERELEEIVKLEHQVLPVLADSEFHGIALDKRAWNALWQDSKQSRMDTQEALDDLMRSALHQNELFEEGATKERLRPQYPKSGKDLNYGSHEQIKWLVQTYCKSIGWPVEVVTSSARLHNLRKQYGQEWLAKQASWGHTKSVNDVPLWVIPENKYCVLVNTRTDTLRLARLRKQLPDELVSLLLDYSKYSTLEQTFGNEFVRKHVWPDGRVHTRFHQVITSTGRLSSEPNLQNIPKDQRYRKCFKPAKGNKFVILDYSQIEPRLSAEVSRDEVYVRTFQDHADLYVRVAEAMLGHEVDKSTPEGAAARTVFKVVVLALAYRMGAAKLRDRLTLGMEAEILAGEVEAPTFKYTLDLLTRYFEIHSGIRDYQERMGQLADPKGSGPKVWDKYLEAPVTWVEGPCGRKRFFPPEAENTFTEGPNGPIQSSSATITKRAAVVVYNEMRNRDIDGHIVNLVHDELVLEVPADRAEEVAKFAKELSEAAGKYYVPSVPIIAEYPKGTNGVCDAWIKEAA